MPTASPLCTAPSTPPRMRGARIGPVNARSDVRITPARTGSTSRRRCRPGCFPDHPRAYGEAREFAVPREPAVRITPARTGKHVITPEKAAAWVGSPPRTGITFAGTWLAPARPDHPRVCGEHSQTGRPTVSVIGSPPRVRGTPEHDVDRVPHVRITPACAGSTPRPAGCWCLPADHPRAYGEHVRCPTAVSISTGSPPRVRGAPLTTCDPRRLLEPHEAIPRYK